MTHVEMAREEYSSIVVCGGDVCGCDCGCGFGFGI